MGELDITAYSLNDTLSCDEFHLIVEFLELRMIFVTDKNVIDKNNYVFHCKSFQR